MMICQVLVIVCIFVTYKLLCTPKYPAGSAAFIASAMLSVWQASVTVTKSDLVDAVDPALLSKQLGEQLKRCVDKLSKSTYRSLAPITVFVISVLQSVIY